MTFNLLIKQTKQPFEVVARDSGTQLQVVANLKKIALVCRGLIASAEMVHTIRDLTEELSYDP